MIRLGATRIAFIRQLNSLPKALPSESHILEQQTIQSNLQKTQQLIEQQLFQLKQHEDQLLEWVKQEMRARRVWPPKATRV
ncbi:hypothetical protein DBR47_00330 [Paucibacter sp. KBW04]|nr:hypothetical protein DBR47_00330 [Paucibacter sp. KBW04]